MPGLLKACAQIILYSFCSILEERKDLLRKVARSGKSTDCRVMGVTVLALVVFIASEDPLETLATMEFLQSLFAIGESDLPL